jgi:hypothetical protein
MRLKTKLVLAITALVFLISGVLSLVYVSQHEFGFEAHVLEGLIP